MLRSVRREKSQFNPGNKYTKHTVLLIRVIGFKLTLRTKMKRLIITRVLTAGMGQFW